MALLYKSNIIPKLNELVHYTDFPAKDNSRGLDLFLEELKITEKDPDKIIKILKATSMEDIVATHKAMMPVSSLN